MPRRPGSRLPATVRTGAQVAAAAPELTRRQLEYWVEMGWVFPDGTQARGHPREFSPRELRILGLMYSLTVAGFPARSAAWIARQALSRPAPDGGPARVELVPGIAVVIDV